MIPNILYSILSRNNDNNNNSNNDNDDPNDENTSENNLGSRNIHLHDSTHLDQIIVSQQQQQQLQQLQQQMQELQLQDGEGQAPMTPTTSTTSTNQSVFNNDNLRFGAPLCILRTPPDFVVPSAYENSSEQQQQQQQQQPLSAILLPPYYNPSQSDKSTETAKTFDETSGGKFADKYSLHVIPVENNNNLFINRISYNTQTNAYYENGDLSNKYLKRWNEGVYQYDNIDLKIEYDWMKTYLARVDNDERMKDDGEISWKFDYRTAGGYIINSLNLGLSFGTFDNLAKVQWFIKPLPTMKNPDPTWQLIQIDEYTEDTEDAENAEDTEDRHEVKENKNVTQFVKNEYGFILKARLSGGVKNGIAYQKSQLFRQNWSRVLAKNIDIENDETFGLDIKVELKPEIIVDPLPEMFVLNDKSTSDFVIHYNFSNTTTTTTTDNQDTNNSDNNETNETKDFHVHSMLLSKRSDYFSALLDSKMVESQNKSLTLTDADISYESLEIILNYLYTGKLPDIKSYDEWTTLLRYSSRFLVPTLIQRCEKALKDHLNHDNLNEIETIASEYGAEQLLHCCEGFEPAKK